MTSCSGFLIRPLTGTAAESAALVAVVAVPFVWPISVATAAVVVVAASLTVVGSTVAAATVSVITATDPASIVVVIIVATATAIEVVVVVATTAAIEVVVVVAATAIASSLVVMVATAVVIVSAAAVWPQVLAAWLPVCPRVEPLVVVVIAAPVRRCCGDTNL